MATTLLASATVTTTGTTAAASMVDFPDDVSGGVFQLAVTSSLTDTTDTIRVWIQSSVDGTNFDDFVAFNTADGSTTSTELAAWVPTGAAPEDEIRTPQDGALAAGSVINNPQGHVLRVKYSIVEGNASSFTFSVIGQYYRNASR